MVITKEDKQLLLSALVTEQARLKRSINVSPNQAIKEILGVELANSLALTGRLTNEVCK